MSEYIIQMKSIQKSYNSNKVLSNVDFNLKKGSIHALLGENGTGKTTLMNILGGVISKDNGEIYVNGEKCEIENTSVAVQKGISFIHQELTLINDLNIFENIYIGNEIKNGIKLNKKEMYKKTAEILKNLNISIEPDTLVRNLNAAYRQIVEIARALMKKSSVIIMDEPTSSLNEKETKKIFGIMRQLKNQNVSIIFISHKLDEVIEICDSYTVMRDGNIIAEGEITPEITETVLAKHMVGKELSFNSVYKQRKIDEVILELKNLSSNYKFRNINLNIKKGEIVGVTGLMGDGRSEVFESVYGCRAYDGDILLNGKLEKITSTTIAQKLGISYVPGNRKEKGIIKDLSISENMAISILKNHQKFFWIMKKKINSINTDYIKNLHIKVSDINDGITSLSGGNQQKVVIAKALESQPQILILDNPTQGVDVNAKLEIYSIIMKLAESGVSVIVLSGEPQEVLMLCDRIYVMNNGEIKKEFTRNEFSKEKIMIAATGT